METTWHRITRSDWYANGIGSHDAADCTDPAICAGEVIDPQHQRYDLRDGWMRMERERQAATPESRSANLADLAARAASIRSETHSAVDDARLAGMSWEAIGVALGMTKQGAQQKFRRGF